MDTISGPPSPSTPPLSSSYHHHSSTASPSLTADTSIVTPHGPVSTPNSYFPLKGDQQFPFPSRGVLDSSAMLGRITRGESHGGSGAFGDSGKAPAGGLGRGKDLPLPPRAAEVDESVKGIPQGWEDDLSIPLAEDDPPTRLAPTSPHKAVPNYKLRSAAEYALSPPRGLGPGPAPHHSRLNSFRSSTKTKLATWRDRNFPELASAASSFSLRGNDEMWKTIGGLTPSVGDSGPPAPGPAPAQQLRRKVASGGGGAEMRRVSSLGAEAALQPRARHAPPSLDLSTPSIAHTGTESQCTADLFDYTACTTYPEPYSPRLDNGQPLLENRSSSSLPLSRTLSVDTHGVLHTPKSAKYQPSITSTESSSSKRDRVLGLRADPPALPGGTKVFVQPNLHDVLPFAAGRPFSAWDVPANAAVEAVPPVPPLPAGPGSAASHSSELHRGKAERWPSLSLRQVTTSESNRSRSSCPTAAGLEGVAEEGGEGWRVLPRPIGVAGQKRVYVARNGDEVGGAYKVGWERDVLDMEARLHETVYELADEKHSFAVYPEGVEPKSVLDIGTGAGLWPISQALVWKGTRFVGLDIVPVQVDLGALAAAEAVSRSTSAGPVQGEGIWEGIARRVTWDKANFLDNLPYDSGVFEHVHLRFLALAIPEPRWADVLEEAVRVLAPGGTLELVELGITLPPACPASVKRSFASLLLADMIHPNPSLPIKFALPTIDGLVHSSVSKPVFEGTWRWPRTGRTRPGTRTRTPHTVEPPGCLTDAAMCWVRSAHEYKGTGLVVRRDPSASFGLGPGPGSGSVNGTGRGGVHLRPRAPGVGDTVVRKAKAQLGWVGRTDARWDFGRAGGDGAHGNGRSGGHALGSPLGDSEDESDSEIAPGEDDGLAGQEQGGADADADAESEAHVPPEAGGLTMKKQKQRRLGASVVGTGAGGAGAGAGAGARAHPGAEEEGIQVWAWVGRKKS